MRNGAAAGIFVYQTQGWQAKFTEKQENYYKISYDFYR